MKVRTLAAFGAFFVAVAGIAVGRAVAEPPQSSIYEVRSYHFDPARFDEYVEVAKGEYQRYLREHLDVVGFYVGEAAPTQVNGAPQDELGSANVTWIIRWDSKEQRDEQWGAVMTTPEWGEIFADVPGGGQSYKRIEVRFMESLY